MKIVMYRKIIVMGIIFILSSIVVTPSVLSSYKKNILTFNEDDSRILKKSNTSETEYYAVICACSRYQNPKYNIPRPVPAPDSKLMVLYNELLQTKNWNTDHIILLLNQNATKQNITHALELMSSVVDENDIFLFTWNGHGSEITDVNGDEAVYDSTDTHDEVICPFDIIKIDHNLTNIITDDELGYFFSNIHAKGKCLIFESCLSGGLVDQKDIEGDKNKNLFNTVKSAIFQTDVLNDIKDPMTTDVNGNNTIVIMSTLPSTLGRATEETHSPLLYSIATIIGKGEMYDKNNDGFLSAEEIFRMVRPMTLIMSSQQLISLWISAYLFFKFDLYTIYDSFIPRIVKIYKFYDALIPIPALSGTSFLLYFFISYELLIKVRYGHYLLNWPNMQDTFSGELPLIEY